MLTLSSDSIEPFSVNASEFKSLRDDVWSIENDTPDRDHESGFTVELPKQILQLYSYPGDTIADPFGGHATTLCAARILNEQVYPDQPDWKGFAWENFASESADQHDYRKGAEKLVSGGLAKFL